MSVNHDDQNNFENFKEGEDKEEYVKKGFYAKAKSIVGKVPFIRDAVMMYYCAIDHNTPMWVKGVAFTALAYLISPIDAIPDTIPIAGFTDDAGAIAAAIMAIGSNITDKHREEAKAWEENRN